MSKAMATVLRLRRLDIQQAQRAFATALAAEAAAAAVLAEAETALQRETDALNPAELVPLQNFAAWLPQGTDACLHAARIHRAAGTAVTDAREDLAGHRAALKAAESLAAETLRIEAQGEGRRLAHVLDDLVRSRSK